MEIIKFPDKRLLTPCKLVTEFGPELKATLDNMYKTMLKADGKGLASNQVGLNIRVFVMKKENGTRINVINPFIANSSKVLSSLREGCLSSPGDYLIVGRPLWVLAWWQDLDGSTNTHKLEDIDAVAFCHELDHLNGKVFFHADTVSNKIKKRLDKKWKLK